MMIITLNFRTEIIYQTRIPFAVADAVAVVAVVGLIAAKNLAAVAFEIGPVAEPVAFAFVAVVAVNAATVTDYADCLSCAVMMSY